MNESVILASDDSIGARFVRAGLMTPEQVARVVELQRGSGERFGDAAVRLKYVTAADVQRVLAEQYRYATALGAPPAVDASLAIAHAPFSHEAEAIRRLRSELSMRLVNPDEPTRLCIAIVSPNANEGKSYLAASLAVAFSQSNIKTLLVNTNLRTSGQRELFKTPDGPGLSTMLAGRALPDVGAPIEGFPNLHVLRAGPTPPNPLEILQGPALGELLTTFRERFACIVLDTPELTGSADAQVIARHADACVLVARQHITRLRDLQRAHELITVTGTPVLGTVYNNFSG